MTTYVFDSGPLIDLFKHYYRERFPTLWTQFDELVRDGRITSTREVLNELSGRDDALSQWCKANKTIFVTPGSTETEAVRQIFKVPHFQTLIRSRDRMNRKPIADPFVIARAMCIEDACVVTTEKHTPNAAKVPNVCERFKIDCMDLEGFMERENWSF